ncbi:MAG: carboxylating nicotinate-nucleotide diphosphorylase [Terriglobia bacterium]
MHENDPLHLDDLISKALQEDLGLGDITTRAIVPSGHQASGDFVAKEELVLAGWMIVERTFQHLSDYITSTCFFKEGDLVPSGSLLARVAGPATVLLSGERVALNFLQHLCGVATLTRKFVQAVSGSKAVILDTRKTTPGFRAAEKYAVRVGGGRNHRLGLADGVLIKENHITAAGGVGEAVRRARAGVDHLKKIEVEVTTLEELNQALHAGADAILLDNMTVEAIRKAVHQVEKKVPLEVSGGVTLDNIRAFAATGVDYISVGALTHSAKASDISFELKL